MAVQRHTMHCVVGVSTFAASCLGAAEGNVEPGSVEPPLVTDRPGNANAARTVPAMRLQIEAGANQAWDMRPAEDAHLTHFPIALRLGLLDRVELRALNGLVGIDATGALGDSNAHSTDTLVGTKLQLLINDGWMPDLAFVADVVLPSGSGAFTGGAVSVDGRLAAAWALPVGFGLLLNAGLDVPEDAEGRFARGLYVVNLGYVPPIGDRALSVFVESFGMVAFDGRPDVAQIDLGAAYLVAPTWQIDLFSQHALTAASPDLQVGLGLSTRFF